MIHLSALCRDRLVLRQMSMAIVAMMHLLKLEKLTETEGIEVFLDVLDIVSYPSEA